MKEEDRGAHPNTQIRCALLIICYITGAMHNKLIYWISSCHAPISRDVKHYHHPAVNLSIPEKTSAAARCPIMPAPIAPIVLYFPY